MNANDAMHSPTAIIGGLLIMFGIPGLAFALIFVQYSQAKKNLTALAGRMGFAIAPSFLIPSIRRSILNPSPKETGILGEVRGRSVRFVKYRANTGRYDHKWTEVAVFARAGSFAFTMWPIKVLVGHSKIKVGDEEFDRHWRLKSSQPEMLKAMLLPELRRQIDQTAARHGEFHLEYNYVRYREEGGFDNAKRVARLEGMVDLLCNLAEAIEVAAEKYSTPSSSNP